MLAGFVTACGSPVSTATPATPATPGGATATPGPVEPSALTSPGDAPPDVALLVAGRDPLVGALGGYTWLDGGSDAPWLRGTPGGVSPDRPLQFGLARDLPIDTWSAAYAAGGDPFPGQLFPLAPSGSPLEVVPPPVGTWTVVLRLTFGQGLGEAAYYWSLTVG
jgi:hypothetical protein